MLVYLFMVVCTLLLSATVNNNYRRGQNYEIVRKRLPLSFYLIFIIWASVFSMRYFVGTDFGAYYVAYKGIGNYSSFSHFVSNGRDFLFRALEYTVYQMSGGNWIVFAAICACIIYLPVLKVINRISVAMTASICLYIFGMHYFFCFNGTRQAIACSLSFYAFQIFLKKKKYLPFAALMVAAFGFHATAIFLLPFFYIATKPLSSGWVKWSVVGLLISYIFLWPLWNKLIALFAFLGQEKLANDYSAELHYGSTLFRAMVYLLPAFLEVINVEKLRNQYGDVDSDIILSIFAAMFMLISTKYSQFARMASYFSITEILMIPKLKCVFNRGNRKIAMLLIYVLYFGYMLVFVQRESALVPYTSILKYLS